MREVTRWVCGACGGVYFNAPTGRCPGCNGQGGDRVCVEDDAGVVKPKES
jgi:hypothetical protein